VQGEQGEGALVLGPGKGEQEVLAGGLSATCKS